VLQPPYGQAKCGTIISSAGFSSHLFSVVVMWLITSVTSAAACLEQEIVYALFASPFFVRQEE